MRGYLEAKGSGTLYVATASPWQNGYAESFHSKLRDGFLECEEFESVAQAQALAALWKEEYDTEPPHSSLRYQISAEFAAACRRYVPIEDNALDSSSPEQAHRSIPIMAGPRNGGGAPERAVELAPKQA